MSDESLLDIFHAVQRISTKISKCHPFYSKCLQDLSLVFRDPKDQGCVHVLETPPPTVLVDNLKKIVSKWKYVDYETHYSKCNATDNCYTKAHGKGLLITYQSWKGHKQK